MNNPIINTPNKISLLIVSFVFLTLSVYVFYDKLELYIIEKNTMEVVSVLFGQPIPTNYQGKQLMPNNNSSAYFVSNHSTKSSYKNDKKYNNQIQVKYSYNTEPIQTDINKYSQLIIDNSVFEKKNIRRTQNKESLSNTFEFQSLNKLDKFTPFRDNLVFLQDIENESFAIFSNNEPFRVIQVDPDPEDPEENPLPLSDELPVLAVFSAIFILLKIYISRKNTITK